MFHLPTPILAAGIPLVLFAAVFCFAVIITIGG